MNVSARMLVLVLAVAFPAIAAAGPCYEPPPDRMLRTIKATYLNDGSSELDVTSLAVRDRIRALVDTETATRLHNLVRGFDPARLHDALAGQMPKAIPLVELLTSDVQAFVNSLGGIKTDALLARDPAAPNKAFDQAKSLFVLKAMSEYAQPTDAGELQGRVLEQGQRLAGLFDRVKGSERDPGYFYSMDVVNLYGSRHHRRYTFDVGPTRGDMQQPGTGPVRGDSSNHMEDLAAMVEAANRGVIPANDTTTMGFLKEQRDMVMFDEATKKWVLKPGVIAAGRDNGLLADRPLSPSQTGGTDPYTLAPLMSGASLLAKETASIRPDVPLDLLRYKLAHASQTILYITYYEGPPGTEPHRPGAVQIATSDDILSDPSGGSIKVPEAVQTRVIDIPIFQHLHNDLDSPGAGATIGVDEQVKTFEKMVDAVDTPVTLPRQAIFPALTPPGPPGVNTMRVVPGPVSYSAP